METIIPIRGTDILMGVETKTLYKKVNVLHLNTKNKTPYVVVLGERVRYEKLRLAAKELVPIDAITILSAHRDNTDPSIRHVKYLVNGKEKNIALPIPPDDERNFVFNELNSDLNTGRVEGATL